MTFKEDIRRFEDIRKNSVKCKCSHTMILGRADRKICSYCGNWVYKTPYLKFKYKIEESLNKEAKNDNQVRQIIEDSNTKSNKRINRG